MSLQHVHQHVHQQDLQLDLQPDLQVSTIDQSLNAIYTPFHIVIFIFSQVSFFSQTKTSKTLHYLLINLKDIIIYK